MAHVTEVLHSVIRRSLIPAQRAVPHRTRCQLCHRSTWMLAGQRYYCGACRSVWAYED